MLHLRIPLFILLLFLFSTFAHEDYTLGSLDINHLSQEALETEPVWSQTVSSFNPGLDADGLPINYDFREAHPECVQEVRNQRHCGGCWAFAAVEALEDRICLATNGNVKVRLSVQNLINCDKLKVEEESDDKTIEDCKGCGGGCGLCAIPYMEDTGTVLDVCQPFIKEQTKADVYECSADCDATAPVGTSNRRYYCENDSLLDFINDPSAVKRNIFENGPMHTYFKVYADFYEFRSGILYQASDDYHGGHAVKIVGWGKENGIDYWIAQNSWGPDWGENGFFKVKWGEIIFAKEVFACMPKIEGIEDLSSITKEQAEAVSHQCMNCLA